MLELITDSGNVGIHDIDNDYTVTHKWSGLNTLHFEVYVDDPLFNQLAEEALIYETTEGQTYLIKGIDAGATRAAIDCEINLDDWKASVYLDYYNNTSAIAATMSEIMPQGWSVSYDKADSQRRSVNLDSGGTPLDVALMAQESYSCAMQFDNANRVCRVYYPQSNPVSDTVLTESAAMQRRPEYVGKSTDLVTRVYPVGADGLTIGKVNGGKNYVENHSYTDKVICQVWKDERYENAQELKADAQALVDSLAVPDASWEVSLNDLYRADPQKWADHKVELYQRIKFQYGERQITATVAEEEVHPHHSEHNTVCINSVPGNFINTLSGLAESVNNPNSAYNSKRDAAIANATKLIVGSSGGHVVTVLDANGKPQELCILSDTDNIATAKSLWRWNEGGLGHSNNGYNGPYDTAITKDGAINASLITTGKLITEVLDVVSIFAEDITATGTINFNNGIYKIVWDDENNQLVIRTDWGAKRGLNISGSPLSLHSTSEATNIDISASYHLNEHATFDINANAGRDIVLRSNNSRSSGNIVLRTLDAHNNGNDGSIIVNDRTNKYRKLVFADDGAVRWEDTTWEARS